MNPRPEVTIVDDDAGVRDSLSLLLGLHGYAVRAYASGEALLDSVREDWRGCLLIDLRMPGMDGLALQAALTARGVALPVIILTAHGDAANARAALKAGAFDFLEKPVDDALLIEMIEGATRVEAETHAATTERTQVERRIQRLTPRERQVFDLVVAGRHNREIAATLDISPRTVEVYKARMMDKLQVDRLPDLIRLSLNASNAANSVREAHIE
ncbi:MAG TPA: response regulator [Casimicrobiaceae bacterium]|nr:response regulator [Casimicrobiaceae bacterium]